MKTDMKNKNILQALTGIFVVSVLMIGALSIAPLAHADDGGDYTGNCCDTGWYDVGSGYTPTDTGTGWYDVGSGYTPTDTGTGWYDVGSGYTPTSGYSTSGYSTGGYSTGGYSIGGHGYSTGGSSNSTVYAPTTVTTNNNTCTNNSCNTNISNPAPVINNVIAYPPTQTQQYCAAGYYGTYPNCYPNQPIVYNTATPYVSLTQVPYTGLDLGFWGTIAYWGAMVLFALVVAYLIVIKRVQNTIALRLKYFLFGTTGVEESSEEVVVAHAPVASNVYATVPTNEDIVDSFILSQINRPRRA